MDIDYTKATIVDVRTPGEFQMGSVTGSINIPLNEVMFKLDEFKNMSKPIVLCCASGGRSGQATKLLKDNGIEEVYNGGSWTMVRMRM